MTEWQIVLLTGAVGFITALVTALVTSAVTHRNEIKKQVMENRVNLYFDFCNEADRLLNNSNLVYDMNYISALLKYKPKFKLLSSEKTTEAFKNFFELVVRKYENYMKYYSENDPREDSKFINQFIDENGIEQEFSTAPEFLVNEFERDVEKFKKENAPQTAEISNVLSILYTEMRKDLGSNIK